MNYKDFEKKVIRENSLAGIANLFIKSNDTCWHIDRHVFDIVIYPISDIDVKYAACMVGVRLMIKWSEERSQIQNDNLIISIPLLIVDDDWLNDIERITPPHVYICLAKKKDSFYPAVEVPDEIVTTTGDLVLDNILCKSDIIVRKLKATDLQNGALYCFLG